ncbi:hypothetical protein [Shimia sp.]|uniref:hypothetical protein n=1 Tax=Shimia sp. TaxID=1954381 RepID=UPI003B8CFC41
MPIDLFEIDKNIETARSDRWRRYQFDLRLFNVCTRVHALFDDPQYPKRQRSFGAIQKSLGVFDNKEDELRDILFDMGAVVIHGEDDTQHWYLPNTIAPPTEPEKPKPPYRIMAIAVIVVAIPALIYFDLGPQQILNLILPPPTREDCIAQANGVMTEILKCNARY